MDMPPTGWYPDPFRVPGLLRWWDGSAWTEHTQAFEASVQKAAERGGTGLSGEPETSLDLPRVATAVQPAVSQAAATSLDLSPGWPDPAPLKLPATFDMPGNATRVFSRDDYQGYEQAMRRRRLRRRWIMALLSVVVVAVLGVMALMLLRFGKQPAKQTAALNTAPVARHTTAAPSASPTPAGPVVTDSSAGLSYTQLGSPWQANCPQTLSGQTFAWTAGESAVAGQVTINGQQGPWYGNACSGPLPQQYGYNGVQDLNNAAQNLSNTFQNSYYLGVQHTASPVVSTPLQISGHAAWEIKFLMTYPAAASQGMTWTSELAAIVVVDRGAGQAPAVFYTSMPSNLGENNVDSLVQSLRVPGSTVSPSASPAASGTAGGGNNP